MRGRYGLFTPADTNTDTEIDTNWVVYNKVSTRTGKPGKMKRHFPVREKSEILNRLEKSGNITQNNGSQGILSVREKWELCSIVWRWSYCSDLETYAKCHWALYTLYWYLYRSRSHFRTLCKYPDTRHFCYFRTKERGSEIDSK